MNLTSTLPESPWPHRLAMAMVCATFPLIWVGGLVTTHQAGMAVPDWPNTYGYNLFLYPLSTWLAGPFDLFIEHGHRLLGAVVGVLAIAFLVAVWRSETRRWMRTMAMVALAGVCFQGALGGMRVVLNERTFAMIHACVGPAFFAFTVALAAITSRSWRSQEQQATHPASARIQRLAVITTVLAYLQLILVAQLRHTPIDAGPEFFRAALYFHLLIAAALVAHAIIVARATMRASDKRMEGPALGLVALIVAQLSLGGATWVVRYGWPSWLGEYAWNVGYTVRREDFLGSFIITAHVALGSLILATSLLLALRAFRWSSAVTRRGNRLNAKLQLAEVTA